MTPPRTAVLFVCMGNICRSPLAEGVFAHLVGERGLGARYRIDSAGTGAWHVGEAPDRRSAEVARCHGIELTGCARSIHPSDLTGFDRVIAMDRDNLRAIESLRRAHGGTARVQLLRDFDPQPDDGEVPDPYYGGPRGFDHVYEMVERSCRGLLDELEKGRKEGEEGDAGDRP